MLNKKCSTFQPCYLRDRCALSDLPESAVKQHFYPSDVGDDCKHYAPIFRSWGEGPDSDND